MCRLASLLLVLLASPFASCGHWLRNDQLFYSHPPKMNYTSALTFCESLGGQLAANFTKSDSRLLQSIDQESDDGSWLDAERATSGYRWRLSGQLIEPEMWASGYPNCSGDCGIIFSAAGKLEDRATSSGWSPCCVFNMTNTITYVNLLSKFALVYEEERAGMLMTIVAYKQEKRILQERFIIQQLSDDLKKQESALSQRNKHPARRADDSGSWH